MSLGKNKLDVFKRETRKEGNHIRVYVYVDLLDFYFPS